MQTLTFAPGTRDDFIASLTRHTKFTDESGVRFEIEACQVETIGQVKSCKWVAYAAQALVVRFWDFAKVRASSYTQVSFQFFFFSQKADSLDTFLILLGYVLMHTTFPLLSSHSRQLGSNFWLPSAIISSTVLALLLSLPLTMWFHIPMDPVALTEALPFIICTVGFNKPLRLARAIFSHLHLTTPIGGMSSGG